MAVSTSISSPFPPHEPDSENERGALAQEAVAVSTSISLSSNLFLSVFSFSHSLEALSRLSERRASPNQIACIRVQVQIARNMNIGSGHAFLEGEPCFFDGKAGKLKKNLKTLTLSMFHPLLCKQISLAVMDCESENTENVVIFWKVLNECIQLESGETGIEFNPHGFCFDMAACNREAGVEVFGNGFLAKLSHVNFISNNAGTGIGKGFQIQMIGKDLLS